MLSALLAESSGASCVSLKAHAPLQLTHELLQTGHYSLDMQNTRDRLTASKVGSGGVRAVASHTQTGGHRSIGFPPRLAKLWGRSWWMRCVVRCALLFQRVSRRSMTWKSSTKARAHVARVAGNLSHRSGSPKHAVLARFMHFEIQTKPLLVRSRLWPTKSGSTASSTGTPIRPNTATGRTSETQNTIAR